MDNTLVLIWVRCVVTMLRCC